MLTIDGSEGEGGGQVLRTSLALALVSGEPVRVLNIRARRSKPGLMRQHLTAVQAAVAVSDGRVEGAAIGARELTFFPGKVRAGDYAFSIGTAGSTTLVLQTVLPALMTAPARSTLLLEGGTHNPMSPPFEFLVGAFLPLLRRMGPVVQATLERPGFYPAGGGRLRVSVEPVPKLEGFLLRQRGAVRSRFARAVVASLPGQVAERELGVLAQRLNLERQCLMAESLDNAEGPGNVVVVEIASENVSEVFTGFGERGLSAEAVAERVASSVLAYLEAEVPVGEHLADQLLLPLALAGGGAFHSTKPSQHVTTQAQVIRSFLGIETRIAQVSANVWAFEVGRKAR